VDTNIYIDNSLLLYVSQSGSGPCSYYYRAVSYKVTAIDSSVKESIKSERGITEGYLDPCGASEERLSFEQQNNEQLKNYELYQNFPNPFNPVTKFQFDLPQDGIVTLKVYNTLGEELSAVLDEYKPRGKYTISFNGSNLPSGVYYYKIKAGNFIQVKQMILIK